MATKRKDADKTAPSTDITVPTSKKKQASSASAEPTKNTAQTARSSRSLQDQLEVKTPAASVKLKSALPTTVYQDLQLPVQEAALLLQDLLKIVRAPVSAFKIGIEQIPRWLGQKFTEGVAQIPEERRIAPAFDYSDPICQDKFSSCLRWSVRQSLPAYQPSD